MKLSLRSSKWSVSKDEGGRMKDEGGRTKVICRSPTLILPFILHPSSFILKISGCGVTLASESWELVATVQLCPPGPKRQEAVGRSTRQETKNEVQRSKPHRWSRR